MFTTTKISADLQRAIMLRSVHPRSKRRSKALHHEERHEAEFGTKSYRDGLQRAFNKAKEQIYFNPDMNLFITLTYRQADNTVEQVLYDIKQLIKKESRASAGDRSRDGQSRAKRAKYIFIMEYQKRGSIHVHMIANNFFSLQVNRNNHFELAHWKPGFSSVLRISDFDNNFKPYLYLFKYMKKAQRIGKSFIHTSRNLNNYTTLKESTIDIAHWRTVQMEHTKTVIHNTEFKYYRNYLAFDDTITSQTNLGEPTQWLEQVKSQSMKELEKLLANHSKR